MFSKLVSRNSRRSRKENGLFFGSLIISIIAFYIILSLPCQDVMIFLTTMESQAVDKLLTLIPTLYGAALFILFFLIYYASKFQFERRRHEFGVYLMLGMRQSRLLAMLLAEDLAGSVSALFIGLPAAFLLSELISLITARLVGLGIVGHQMTFSPQAAALTAAGFMLIKLIAFFILSIKIGRQQIGALLVETPDGTKKQLPSAVYALAMLAGALCLAAAYRMAIRGDSWNGIDKMAWTLILGISGTFLLFYGLRFPIGLAAKHGTGDRRLHVFNVRQIQETVIHRSGTLAVCSLLMLAALCCFGAGVAIARFYGSSGTHILDYTFPGDEGDSSTDRIRETLHEHGLDAAFTELSEMKIGHIRTEKAHDAVFEMDLVLSALGRLPDAGDMHVLLNNLSYATDPYLISLESYNALLRIAGQPSVSLREDEAAVYMDSEWTNDIRNEMLNEILHEKPHTTLDGRDCRLTGPVQTTNLVTDRSISLSFALIVPDDVFEQLTGGSYSVYLNGCLADTAVEQAGLMSAIADMNRRLDRTGLTYESYLQNIGRQLFYMVAASYITIYLAIIFLIIANTIIGVQFLMSQQKSGGRYRTLIHLGAAYRTLRDSARRQISWYFGIPAALAAFSSLFGVRALFSGILPSRASADRSGMMVVSITMIFGMCVIEYLYILAVRHSGERYLLSLMMPKREE